MKEVKKLSDDQKALLIQLKTEVPQGISIDDIMALGARRLIEFSKGRGFKLTKHGEKAVEILVRKKD